MPLLPDRNDSDNQLENARYDSNGSLDSFCREMGLSHNATYGDQIEV